MGYNTRVTGEFELIPPVPWEKFKDSMFAPDSTNTYDADLRLLVEEARVDTASGTAFIRMATRLVMREIDEYRAYHLLDQVQKAVDEFAGHTFVGRLNCKGEESGDLWRVVVRDGRAIEVRPEIVWPDWS